MVDRTRRGTKAGEAILEPPQVAVPTDAEKGVGEAPRPRRRAIYCPRWAKTVSGSKASWKQQDKAITPNAVLAQHRAETGG